MPHDSAPSPRIPYLRFLFLALLFVWVVFYEAGPARVQFQAAWTNNHSTLDRVLDPIWDLAVPLFAVVFGFAVAFIKPNDRKAWLLLGMLLSFAQVNRAGPDITAASPWLRTLAVGYQSAGEQLWPGWFLLFLAYFPVRAGIDLRWPWLKWLVLVPFTANGLLLVGQDLRIRGAAQVLHSAGPLPRIIAYGVLASALILLSARYFTAVAADQRRRLSLFYWGTLITLLPAIAVSAARNLLHRHNFDFAPVWVLFIAFSLLTLFPPILAYVILVQRAMDVRVVIRQGIRYALANRGVTVLRAGAIVAVIYTITLLTQRHAGVWPQVLAIAVGIIVVNGIRSIAENARRWIDKRFFREQLRVEELLASLANDVHGIIRTDELVQTLARRVASSLHVDHIGIWLMDGHALTPAYAIGVDGWNVNPLLADLRRSKKPLVFGGVSVGSGAEVALPLMARDELLGTMVLGAKRSEEPYSRIELDVLETVGSQAGLALDNGRLAKSLAQEAAQHERLNREIEIAREVQQTLLPQEGGPPVPHIEYAGVCRPALGVGGDYYDFLHLSDGQFGFAIGDVSGKGVAAALLMASLQASLRGQTLDVPNDLASVIRRMNRLLFEATAPNRYATFFYAQYDPKTRKLAWVNAGHNAPLLFTSGKLNSREIRKLDEGGPVIGLLPDVDYTQGSTVLVAGDLVVAFTDGISEAMNFDDEEWGEARLRTAINSCADGLPISSLLNRLLDAADAHAAGAPQHDDMTLVAIRALA